MEYRRYQCRNCNHQFEKSVIETALKIACPKCDEVVQLGMLLGLTFGQALGLLMVGVVIYSVARSS